MTYHPKGRSIPRIKVPEQPDQPSDVRTLEGIESLGPVSASTVEPTAQTSKCCTAAASRHGGMS